MFRQGFLVNGQTARRVRIEFNLGDHRRHYIMSHIVSVHITQVSSLGPYVSASRVTVAIQRNHFVDGCLTLRADNLK